jgi:hypothetical protein
MGSSKKTQKVEPIYGQQLQGAANTLTGVYNQNAPKIQGYADAIGGLIPSLMQRYQQGDPAMNAARSFLTNTIQNDGPNPYLESQIAQTNNSVGNTVNAKLGTRGLTGGSVQAGMLSRALAENESGLRYADYNNMMQRRMQAAGMAPNMASADLIAISPLLAAAQSASGLPMQAAAQNAAGIGGLLGQYTNTTQKSSGGLLGTLAGIAQVGSMFLSDERAKTDIERVGQTDAGLPLYRWRYKGDDRLHIGPIAQDVEAMQPDALGPEVSGYKTVNYAEVR